MFLLTKIKVFKEKIQKKIWDTTRFHELSFNDKIFNDNLC